MNMFESFFSSIPSNRSEMVNDLEIPDIPLTPFVWEPDPVSDSSLETVSIDELPVVPVYRHSLSTDSSIALSRAMTDSDIDYDWYRRYKRLDLTDPWEQMRIGWAAFPPEHIETLNRIALQSHTTELELPPESIPFETFPSHELLRRCDRFFEEDCRFFEPDDPGLLELEEALQSLDLESLYPEWDLMP